MTIARNLTAGRTFYNITRHAPLTNQMLKLEILTNGDKASEYQ